MKKSQKWLLIISTLLVFFIFGIQFDGSLSHLLERRMDFVNNVQMGGERCSLSFASLKYYISCITEPFAFVNVFGNIGLFMVFAFLVCFSFPGKPAFSSFLYCLCVGIFLELFQYITWLGAFDISDIALRFAGSFMGIAVYGLYGAVKKGKVPERV